MSVSRARYLVAVFSLAGIAICGIASVSIPDDPIPPIGVAQAFRLLWPPLL